METTSKEITITFHKAERSYTTPVGWRLATYEEAKVNEESFRGLFGYWDRARLLDGWIGGAHFENAIENEYKGCVGYMLITHAFAQGSSSSGESVKCLYEDVTLSFESMLVALQLSAEDWNLEVVYWLLNSLSKTESMNLADVSNGRIPIRNASDVDEMKRLNWTLNDLARQLWDDPFSEEEGSKNLDLRSVGEKCNKIGESCWAKFSGERKKLLGRGFLGAIKGVSVETASFLEDYNIGTVSYVWQRVSSEVIVYFGYLFFRELMSRWLNVQSPEVSETERSFILSVSFIYYYYQYYINSENYNPEKSNYTVLDIVFDVAATCGGVILMKKAFDCGARLQITETQTVLHTALHSDVSEDKMVDMVKLCLDQFELIQAEKRLVNAVDEEGMTGLHLASLQGKPRVCDLLLRHGAEPDVQDRRGRLPLHHAVEKRNDKVIDLLIGKFVSEYFDSNRIGMFNFRNSDGQSPLDVAVAQKDIKLMTKLLKISKDAAESYFDKVDGVKLLNEFAFQGSADIVGKLLKSGVNPLVVDEEGKTALHYAAMCRDLYSAISTIQIILDECKDAKTLKEMVDWEDKTALHFAALNGNIFSGVSPFEDLVVKKDMYDRIPLYYVLQGELDYVNFVHDYVNEMEKAGIHFGDLIDSTGQTPLHMAALKGKIHQTNALLSMSRHPKTYVRRADYLGQTALHKAAGGGHLDTMKVLLHWGAQPLLERDCDGRTAMHYVVQAKSGNDRTELAKLLLRKCGSNDRKFLFLWASAAGLGTADQILNDSDPLKAFLLGQKEQLSGNTDCSVHGNNLLKIAACIGDTDMTKELLARGGQIASIEDQIWIKRLLPEERSNVRKVLEEIHAIAEQGNDQPTVEDKLGRDDFARSLAALLLNPYLEPPIAVGISGSWGKGKSSLMMQTEINLLKTAAQSSLLPTPKKFHESSFPGAQVLELSGKGKRKYKEVQNWVDFIKNDSNFNRNVFSTMIIHFLKWIRSVRGKLQTDRAESRTEESQGISTASKSKESQLGEDSLSEFLHNYERKYHSIFKSLAAMDTSDMFSSEGQQPYARTESLLERSVPAVLTVQYNAWMYRNESEALAGLAVQITKEMEGIMTEPQWLSTCLRNTWRKQKQNIWTELLFPCLLAIFFAGFFSWIAWIVLDRYDAKEVVQLKYASVPATIVIMVWTLVKSVMSIAKPVSTQLMNYIKLPDHSEKLGYQERVISDINFLKEEIGKKPYFLCTVSSCVLRFIAECCTLSFLYPKFFLNTIASAKAILGSTSYASVNPRIVVFVDDLDRCQESVILQVLSAINLVLAVCKINVIVGMDKSLIERAIIKKFGDKSMKNSQQLADHYLQKIIQLPLDLPDPSEDESKRFLDTQLGVFSRTDKKDIPEPDVKDNVRAEVDDEYDALFSIADRGREFEIRDLGDHLMKMFSPESSKQDAALSGETCEVGKRKEESSECVAIDVPPGANTDSSRKSETAHQSIGNAPLKPDAGNQSLSVSMSIRDMLFVRYSEGERDAFCHFQKMATDFRKLPREWKRLLCYHRLVWYILYVGNEVNSLLGWQVQLITWVFACWEWQEQMNTIIENWNTIGILRPSRSDSSTPSLRAIVEYFIKEESRIIADNKDENMPVAGGDKNSGNKEPKAKDFKEKGIYEKTEDPEGNKTHLDQEEEIFKEKKPAISETHEGETKDIAEHSENKDLKGKGVSEIIEDFDSSNAKIIEVEETATVNMPTMPDHQRVTSQTIEGETKEASDAAPATLAGGMDLSNSSKDPESGKIVQSNEIVKDEMMRETDGVADVSIARDYSDCKNRDMSPKLHEVVENVGEEVKKVLREEINKTSGKEMDELRKEIDKLQKEMEKLHKELKELKVVKQQSGKNKKSEEERKMRLKTWKRMRSALRRYDVSMEGIRAFQRFRFYCVAGYLPWPLPEKENEDL